MTDRPSKLGFGFGNTPEAPEAVVGRLWEFHDQLPEIYREELIGIVEGLIELWLLRGKERGGRELEEQHGLKFANCHRCGKRILQPTKTVRKFCGATCRVQFSRV